MEDFWGFFPRSYLPATKIYNDTGLTDLNNIKATVFFIDSV